jgi:hypothetical protein
VNKKITTSAANLAFKADLERVQNWLIARVSNWWGYKSTVITERLLQQVINSVLSVYAMNIYNAGINGATSPPSQSEKCLSGHGCSVRFDTGAITVSIRQWINAQASYLVHWGACFASVCIPSVGISRKMTQATLVFGVGDSIILKEGNGAEFSNYIENIGFDPISQSRCVWFESEKEEGDKSIPSWKFARWPLLSLTRFCKLGLFGRISLAATLMYQGFQYAQLTLRYPFLVLLSRDIPYCALAQYLDHTENISSVVLTCSNFRSQPLWMRGLKRSTSHMIWYSQNWLPIVRISDKVSADNPYIPWIRIKTHWVWTKEFGEYLARVTQCEKINTIGPIVWQPLLIKQAPIDRYIITLFDVPPFDDDVAIEEEGNVCNYYSYDNIKRFLLDIIEIVSILEASIYKRSVELRVKPKRAFSEGYSSKYYQDIEDHKNAGELVLLPPDSNLGAAISESHLIIAIPFTSPAYIAEEMRIPSIFYDPSCDIVDRSLAVDSSYIHFASGKHDLFAKISKMMAEDLI